jgi:hypothetical protein
VSVLNWDLAARSGLQEEALLPAYEVYGHAIAAAGVAQGRICGIAGLGLLMDTRKGNKLAWFPGVFLVYHCISYQFWTGNRRKAAHKLVSDPMRIGWPTANLVAGALAIPVARNAGCGGLAPLDGRGGIW